MTNHPMQTTRRWMVLAVVLATLVCARRSAALLPTTLPPVGATPTTLPGATRGTILEPVPPVGGGAATRG